MFYVYAIEENKIPGALILADPAGSFHNLLESFAQDNLRLSRVKTTDDFNELVDDLDVWFPPDWNPSNEVTFDDAIVILEPK